MPVMAISVNPSLQRNKNLIDFTDSKVPDSQGGIEPSRPWQPGLGLCVLHREKQLRPSPVWRGSSFSGIWEDPPLPLFSSGFRVDGHRSTHT